MPTPWRWVLSEGLALSRRSVTGLPSTTQPQWTSGKRERLPLVVAGRRMARGTLERLFFAGSDVDPPKVRTVPDGAISDAEAPTALVPYIIRAERTTNVGEGSEHRKRQTSKGWNVQEKEEAIPNCQRAKLHEAWLPAILKPTVQRR